MYLLPAVAAVPVRVPLAVAVVVVVLALDVLLDRQLAADLPRESVQRLEQLVLLADHLASVEPDRPVVVDRYLQLRHGQPPLLFTRVSFRPPSFATTEYPRAFAQDRTPSSAYLRCTP